MRNMSLKGQIIGLVTAIVAIALVSLTALTVDQIETQSHYSLQQKGRSVSAIIAENLGPGLDFQDSTYVADIVQGAFVDDDVLAVAVFDSDRKLVTAKSKDLNIQYELSNKKLDQSTFVRHTNECCAVDLPVLFRGDTVGYVSLAVTHDNFTDRIHNSIYLIVSGALVLLALCIVAAIFIARRIVKPIHTFEEAANRISSGDMTSQLDLDLLHKDFKPLGITFNDMRLALGSAFEELNQARDLLETKVDQRTRELQNELSERERAEEAMRSSETRYRKLFDATTDAILIIKDGLFIDCNQCSLTMFGCTRDQIVGSAPTGFSPEIQPDGRKSMEGVQDAIGKALKGAPQFFAWQHQQYDGTLFDTEVSLTKLEVGSDSFIIAFVRDVTQRKLAEQEHRDLIEKYERAERMESLGVLAGGIAHDLNNMLGPVVGYAELIMHEVDADSKMGRRISRIGKSARDAADVIQDLLTLARRGRYEMTPVSLAEIIADYLDSPSFRKLDESRPDIKLTLSMDESAGYISGSAPHLSKVFMNMIVNACDAMPDGGTLSIDVGYDRLSKLYSGFDGIEPGEYVVVRITDTGTGINPEDIEKIFEPYYSNKKMGTSGSGLGLSVVYGIVKDHKGYYDVISEVGQGTEFVLYFPVVKVVHEKTESPKTDLSGTEVVLVVDDIPEQREMASELLGSFGYEVHTAESGLAAVEFLKNNQVDLMVLDMIMENDFDGLDTYLEVIKIHPEQKVVIVSGFSATDRVKKMQELGAGQYVKKPYTRETIGTAVRQELDRIPASTT